MKSLNQAAAAAALILLLAGCAKPDATTPSSGTGASSTTGSIQVKGSDTLVMLAQSWAQEFMQSHRGISVSVTGGGSSTGITAITNKGADVCNASRSVTPDERAMAAANGVNLVEHVVAQDALSVIINRSNPVTELSLAQLRGIYSGKIRNWNAIGGPDRRIIVNARESSSGTYVFFQEHVLGKRTPYSQDAMLQPSNSQIARSVADDAGAIGYVGLGYVTDSVKAVRLKKTPSAPAVAANAADVLNGSYPLARPLFQYTNGTPRGAVKTWMDWVTGPEGQAIVRKLDFVPVAK